jgi:hypothetical protein
MSDQDARASQLAAERANYDTDPDDDPLECLEDHTDACRGDVQLRLPLSGTGTPFARCDFHWERRLELEAELNERYPVHPPADWSPLDAGEAWSEEDY